MVVVQVRHRGVWIKEQAEQRKAWIDATKSQLNLPVNSHTRSFSDG